ncbi:MAG: hypothetical protein FJ303_21470 [Planctomycetes bacterium]|nr:hypothetical protein [Planctomycetota bacterium]
MDRRIIAALLFIGSISGCVSTNDGPETGGMRPHWGQTFGPPTVPGVKGPYGEGVPMAPPYDKAPPANPYAAMRMMQNQIPLNYVQFHQNGMITPPGVMGMPGTGPGMPGMPGMPPMPGLKPGMMPGMPGPMPGAGNPLMKTGFAMTPDAGLVNANVPPGAKTSGGVTPAQFAGSSGPQFPTPRTQVFFTKPAGMKVHWFTVGSDGKPNYSTIPLDTPGRYNFAQGAIYRLKLTHIPGRPALPLYPTLEVVPTGPKTNEFLAHNSVPVEFTDEDFKQVVERNYIVKVIYLPDPQFQEGAGAGPDEISSTRLEAGQDPIQVALQRGSILLVIRIGNIDQGLEHSPAMTTPGPGGAAPGPMKLPGQGVPPLFQIPFPTTPIAPGGPTPNILPPFPGLNPGGLPTLPLPPVVRPEDKKDIEPKKDEKKLDIVPKKEPKLEAVEIKKPANVTTPAIELPVPPGLKSDLLPLSPPPVVTPPANNGPSLPVAPPLDKGPSSSTLPPSPVVPAGSTKTPAPILSPSTILPTLPSIDSLDPTLPTIPMPRSGSKK